MVQFKQTNIMFVKTKSCPKDVSEWRTREKNFNCSYPKEVYHCLSDGYGRLGETCIKGLASWVEKDYCPEYNMDTNNVNTVPCHGTTDCPSKAFKSNEVYEYPVCVQEGTTLMNGGPSSLSKDVIALSVAAGVFVLLVVLSVMALLCYRKRRSQETRNRKEEKIHLLSADIPPFYKTSIFHKANAFLKDGGKILCLIGEWGSGKSTTAKEVYMSITGRTPAVIEDILKFDVSTCQDSIIVEEALPRESISEIETSDIVEKMISLC
ncbi:uncharacterized protein LOC134235726 [Saccostrea cucullata]|uniref:uncharacterized protein LOC134235726 n=1 Tax=Saccostrea cuccullata TaxID=36930 RepID=UPI002ED1DD34